ncbi:hypothetical protein ACQ4PT_002525 [Festuca glaucescens]
MGNCLRSFAGKEFPLPSSSGSGARDVGGRFLEPNLHEFTLAELRVATRQFKQDLILGVGGFGPVYKGWVEDVSSAASSSSGVVVAVKRLNEASTQGLQEWKAEITYLDGLEHPNMAEITYLGGLEHSKIVRLLSHCGEDMVLLHVYEYMEKGSLENHLFKSTKILSLTRLTIAIAAAIGLAFLHERDVIYRDLKS